LNRVRRRTELSVSRQENPSASEDTDGSGVKEEDVTGKMLVNRKWVAEDSEKEREREREREREKERRRRARLVMRSSG
jgi:hypothetical protein